MRMRVPDVEQWVSIMRESEISRRQLLKRASAMGLAIPAVAAILAACEDDEVTDDVDEPPAVDPDDDDDEVVVDDEDDDEPVDEPDDDDEEPVDEPDDDRYGGTFYLAQIGEPPTLDIHQTTATAVAINAWHMYEPLFTWDEDLALTNELAQDIDISDDGLNIVVTLREGVNFHNGDVLDAEDVIASIERWGRISGLGADLLDAVDEMVIVDDLTIEFQMNDPLGTFSTMLARQNQGCAIYPKSVIDESTDESLADYVGTGPFQLVEHIPDRHIHYSRFDDYTDRPEPPSGYAGSKARYLDEMFFQPVPDEAARIAGLQTGEYHYLESIVPDHFNTLEDDERVAVELLSPTSWGTLVVNHAEGIMSDPAMRSAVQMALEHDEISLAAYGDGFYRLDPGVMFQETAWHSMAGDELYSPNDPERAREMAEEAGYNGETIRLMATQEYAYMFGIAAIAEQQLEDAGFDVEVMMVDWATLVERRNDSAEWDLFTTGITFRIDPVLLPFMMGTTWPGWWGSDQKVELTRQLQRGVDYDERFAIWEELQELFYEEVPLIKISDQFNLNAQSPLVRGFEPFVQLSPFFWNVWLEEE